MNKILEVMLWYIDYKDKQNHAIYLLNRLFIGTLQLS